MRRLVAALAALIVLAGAAAIGTAPSSLAGALPPGGTYIDDDGNVHEGYIEAITADGISTGCASDPARFCPDLSLTRAQMATLLVGAQPSRFPASGPNAYADDDASIHHDNINRVVAAGVSSGCRSNAFCPLGVVTRGQMASFIASTFNLPSTTTDAFGDDGHSVHHDNINRVAAAGVASGCASGRFCPDLPVSRAQVATFIGKAKGLSPMTPPPPPVPSLSFVAGGLSSPVQLVSPPGDARLFVIEQSGRVRVIKDGSLLTTPYLDLSSSGTNEVLTGGERGLLSIAFHPSFATNGIFYVYFSARGTSSSGVDHHTWVVRFAVPDPDADSAAGATRAKVLDFSQPRSNHNGGQLAFDPNGFLHLSLGDGGGSNDPDEVAQVPSNPLGSTLRYSVSSSGALTAAGHHGAVFNWGLRNPWRYSFDAASGLMVIADVGQGAREEIDVVSYADGGANFGWDDFEGTRCNEAPCNASGKTFPIHEYTHSDGRSITGGFVYRGKAMPRQVGQYFYGDFASGIVRSFAIEGGKAVDHRDWTDELGGGSVASFGLDRDGEMYLVDYGGSIFKIVAA